jgi:nicotinate-nucleotide adenylyltransferase
MTTSQSVGLFGGSFDPVHLGHLVVAQTAQEQLELDRVIFIPAAQSPFKPGQAPASAPDRLRLLRLALAGRVAWEVDDREIRRGGISYTIDTIREMAARFPGARLYYLIGADLASQLPKWRDAGELAARFEFIILPRPGEASAAPPAPFRSTFLEGCSVGVSSSEIRERVRRGLPIDLMVGPEVAADIVKNRLYLAR